MKRGALVVAVILSAFALYLFHAHGANNQPMPPVAIDLTNLGRPGVRVSFTEITQVKMLPQSVVSEFGKLANPGDHYQSTDLILDEHLPTRRLIFAGVSQRFCIVHYEKGGRGHSILVMLFELSNGKAHAIWLSNTSQMANLTALKNSIEAGILTNQLNSSYW